MSRRLAGAAEKTIAALRRTGRLEAVDTLLVALVRSACERADDLSDPVLARQYLRVAAELEARLRSLGGEIDDSFARLLLAASGVTEDQ